MCHELTGVQFSPVCMWGVSRGVFRIMQGPSHCFFAPSRNACLCMSRNILDGKFPIRTSYRRIMPLNMPGCFLMRSAWGRRGEHYTLIGVDLGKHSFHLHGQERHGKALLRKKCSHKQLIDFLANLPCLHHVYGRLHGRALGGPQVGGRRAGVAGAPRPDSPVAQASKPLYWNVVEADCSIRYERFSACFSMRPS